MKTTEDKISTFDTPQYKRVMAACKERDKFPTQAWIPDEEENPEEFMEDVYKKELGADLETVDNGVAIGLVSEEIIKSKAKTKILLLETYTKMYESMKNSADKKRIGKLIEELKNE
jgi:hypothetical protein